MSVLAESHYVKPNQILIGDIISFHMSPPYDWCFVLNKINTFKHNETNLTVDGIELTVLYRDKSDKIFVRFSDLLVQLK
jgi:hypothetical protein